MTIEKSQKAKKEVSYTQPEKTFAPKCAVVAVELVTQLHSV
jgi:hypothetical protein